MKRNPVKCLIIDDEPLGREIIQTHLSKIPGWEVSGTCINAIEAYDVMSITAIEVLFLDIRMPIISGVDFLRSLKNPPLVVFTTAFSNYAVEGFELNAIDYLVKPITFERFLQAIEKLKEALAVRNQNKSLSEPNDNSYTFLKLDNKLIKVTYNDLLYVKAERDFCSVYLKDKKVFASMHLKLFENLLPQKSFIRTHRSYIVNFPKINSINGNVMLIEGHELPIGANYKASLMGKLNIR